MKAALALSPDDGDLVVWQGTVLETLGKADDALGVYRKALAARPKLKAAFDKLSDHALNPRSKAKPSEKKELIEFLSKIGSDDCWFWNNVGFYFREANEPKKSLEGYLKAAALAPNEQVIQNDTGLIYLYHGKQMGEDRRKSLPFFERSLALVEQEDQKPEIGYRDSLLNLATYYREVDPDPEKALLYATKRNDPDFLDQLPADLKQVDRKCVEIKAWAEKELKK